MFCKIKYIVFKIKILTVLLLSRSFKNISDTKNQDYMTQNPPGSLPPPNKYFGSSPFGPPLGVKKILLLTF